MLIVIKKIKKMELLIIYLINHGKTQVLVCNSKETLPPRHMFMGNDIPTISNPLGTVYYISQPHAGSYIYCCRVNGFLFDRAMSTDLGVRYRGPDLGVPI